MRIKIRRESPQGGFSPEFFPPLRRPYFHAVQNADNDGLVVDADFVAQLFAEYDPALSVEHDVERVGEEQSNIVLIGFFGEVPGFEFFGEFEENRKREDVEVRISLDEVQFIDAFGTEDLPEFNGNDQAIFFVKRVFVGSRE
jgi:hypothetical protein